MATCHLREEIIFVYIDYFTIENTARDYRDRRLARAEHERRLALLARGASPFSAMRARLLAVRAGWQRRRSGGAHVAGHGQPVRPPA